MKPAFLGLLFVIANAPALAQRFPLLLDTCIGDLITAAGLGNTPTITTQLEDIPSTACLPATTSVQNSTAELLSVHTSVPQPVCLQLCSTGLHPVTAAITETATESTFTTTTGLRQYVAAATFAVYTSKPASAYTTLTVSHALASPSGSAALARAPGRTRQATSNGGLVNATAFTSMFCRNATAIIQSFSGDATIMYLNFPFVVSIMGIFIVSLWLL